jgi:hypothetical protein
VRTTLSSTSTRSMTLASRESLTFSPIVFETLGAINLEGARVLSQVFRWAADRLGREFSSYCGRGWARFSCNLQRSVSQAILNRVDGRVKAPPVPDEVSEVLFPPPSPSLSPCLVPVEPSLQPSPSLAGKRHVLPLSPPIIPACPFPSQPTGPSIVFPFSLGSSIPSSSSVPSPSTATPPLVRSSLGRTPLLPPQLFPRLLLLFCYCLQVLLSIFLLIVKGVVVVVFVRVVV